MLPKRLPKIISVVKLISQSKKDIDGMTSVDKKQHLLSTLQAYEGETSTVVQNLAEPPGLKECSENKNSAAESYRSREKEILRYESISKPKMNPNCSQSLNVQAQLEAHSKGHDEIWSADGQTKCKLCNEIFESSELYRCHLQEHCKSKTKRRRVIKRAIKYKSSHKCKFCTKSFEKPSQLARHVRVHTGEKPFKCEICSRGYSQKITLKIHSLKHKDIKPYSCSFCNAAFRQKGNLKTHIEKLHNSRKSARIYRCSHCPCSLKTLGNLNSHITKMHSSLTKSNEFSEDSIKESDSKNLEDLNDLKEGFIMTDNVGQTAMVAVPDKNATDSNNMYIKIRQRCVDNVRYYQCTYCDKEFKKTSDLMRHLRIHKALKPYKCPMCYRSFSLKSNMISHQKIHQAVKKLKCQLCGKYFSNQKLYLMHQWSHAKHNEKFSNNYTSKSDSKELEELQKTVTSLEVENLVTSIVLQEPLVINDGGNKISIAQIQRRNKSLSNLNFCRPYKCSYCPAAFTKNSHLMQHQRKHTGEKPYECPKCERKFSSNSTLKSHLHVHESTKAFKCPICDKSFTTLSSMKRHNVTHSDMRPFMCPYCHKTFKTSVNCRKHMKIHKEELVLKQLEKENERFQNLSSKEKSLITPSELGLSNDEMEFQPIAVDDELTRQLQQITESKNSHFLTSNATANDQLIKKAVSVFKRNVQSPDITNASGIIPLSNFDDNIKIENFKEIEDTLERQLFNIGMDLSLNNTLENSEQYNASSLQAHDQSSINLIYDSAKIFETLTTQDMNENTEMNQFENLNIDQLSNHLSLQCGNTSPIDLTSIPTSSASLLTPIMENEQFSFSYEEPVVSSSNQDQMDFYKESYQCHMCSKDGFSADDLKEHLKTHKSCKEYLCIHCDVKFATTAALSSHVKIHNNKPYKCHKCNKFFTTKARLRTHLKIHGIILEKCNNGLIFDDILKKSDTSKEMPKNINLNKESTQKENKDFANKCYYCAKSFRKPIDLTRHVRIHTGEKPFQCEYCNKKFNVKSALNDHMKIHSGEKSFHCYICNAMFISNTSLRFHLKLHTGDCPFKCLYCEERFRTYSARKAHQLSHQNISDAISLNSDIENCDVSSRKKMTLVEKQENKVRSISDPLLSQFNQQVNLQKLDINKARPTDSNMFHDKISMVSVSDTYENSDNGQLVESFNFLIPNGLANIQADSTTSPEDYFSIIQNDSLKCQDKYMHNQNSFNPQNITQNGQNSLLEIEKISCSIGNKQNNNRELKHKCDVCGKSFNKSFALKRHKIIHTKERTFKCDKCGKLFSQKSILQQHKKVHCDKTVLSCSLCKRTFLKSLSLENHLKRVHKYDTDQAVDALKQQFDKFDKIKSVVSYELLINSN